MPKVLDKAKALYEQHGETIETLADEGRDIPSLRKQFPDFEEWDGAYYEAAEQDLPLLAEHIRSNWETFAHIGQA